MNGLKIFIVMVTVCIVFGLGLIEYMHNLTTEVIREEIDRLKQERLPNPSSITIKAYHRAGMDIMQYVVSIDYACNSEEKAAEIEEQIRRALR